MHAITKLVSLILVASAGVLQACDQTISVDPTNGGTPPAGVIRGSVNYVGPPPCSQGGHIVGNAVLLVFDARNPPAPAGLGVTATNFGVVAGDALFRDWPVTQGTTKICPGAGAPIQTVSAPYTISPMSAGRYYIQAFFDYTGDFFATFKFRQLPEALDVGGGYIDLADAQKLVPNPAAAEDAGPGTLPYEEQQADPNYLPHFLPIDIGTAGATPSKSLWGVPSFSMPDTGFLRDDVNVTIAAELRLARPYFYPEGVVPTSATVTPITVNPAYNTSGVRPSAAQGGAQAATPQNPGGNVDFIPVLSFPQDMQVYAQPSAGNLGKQAIGGVAVQILSQYQNAFPQLQLKTGVAPAEQAAAVNTIKTSDPFHMQLGLPNPPVGAAPGGNGGLYVWWNGSHTEEDCAGLSNCTTSLLDFIPESPEVYRVWPMIVLAKLQDLPTMGSNKVQPNVNDPQGLTPQGSDFSKPIVIIQGVTLIGDSFGLTTTQAAPLQLGGPPLPYPDYVGNSNLQDHVTTMLRPSTLCVDPRAPDNGGALVAPGLLTNGIIMGPFPPADARDIGDPTNPAQGPVVDSAALSNPQLARLVNHAMGTNGLITGCLPLGRYQVNMVYPTGQAWTTPNETGSCAVAEGNAQFLGANPDPGTCSGLARPVLYSQGTRAVIEITAATPGSCATFSATGAVPLGLDGKPTADGSPFVCNGLCSDASLDPTALSPKGIPCYKCLDPAFNPSTNPPCTTRL